MFLHTYVWLCLHRRFNPPKTKHWFYRVIFRATLQHQALLWAPFSGRCEEKRMGGPGFEGQRSLDFRGFRRYLAMSKSFWDKFVGGFLKKPRGGFTSKVTFGINNSKLRVVSPLPFFQHLILAILDFIWLRFEHISSTKPILMGGFNMF